ncbi:O-methyltransferase [Acrasis kona]|uniref:O-methyltransferase n=1 Tax=Acrasis kona TaxID=1008807 RepID=A0AAW2Z2I3_9EUKA
MNIAKYIRYGGSVVLANAGFIAFTTLSHYKKVNYDDKINYPQQGEILRTFNHELHFVSSPRTPNQTSKTSVVLIGDYGEPSEVFETLQDAIIKDNPNVNRVIRYDRFGYGYSEFSSAPRHASNMTSEVGSLIEEQKLVEDGNKVVLVGHGSGCLIARLLRDRLKDGVASTVLVSPNHEKMILNEEKWYQGYAEQSSSPYLLLSLMNFLGFIEIVSKIKPNINDAPIYATASPKSEAWIRTQLYKDYYYETYLKELSQSKLSAKQVDESRATQNSITPIVVVNVNHDKEHKIRRNYFDVLRKDDKDLYKHYLEDLKTLSPDSKLETLHNYDHYSVLSSPELANIVRDVVNKKA